MGNGRNSANYGTAVHEAAHVVVAWALGIYTDSVKIGVRGDDTAGVANHANFGHLPLVDQIAIYWSGKQAQRLLNAPTNDNANARDVADIYALVKDYPEREGAALRSAGTERCGQLLQLHRDKLVLLADAVWQHGELDRLAIEQVLNDQSSKK